jgi:hypothetical protein
MKDRDREFMCGSVRFLLRGYEALVVGGEFSPDEGGYTFLAYIVDDGRLRPVGDRAGKALEFTEPTETHALDRALAYLELRFGPVGCLPPKSSRITSFEQLPPLRDERGERTDPDGT